MKCGVKITYFILFSTTLLLLIFGILALFGFFTNKFYNIKESTVTMGEPLVTESVNFYSKENAVIHHTDMFEELNPPDGEPKSTIARRGQEFKVVIFFNRPYNEDEDVVLIRFALGEKPGVDMVHMVTIEKDDTPDKHQWSAKFLKLEGYGLIFNVVTPVEAPVGRYKPAVITKIKNSTTQKIFDLDEEFKFYLLFNPWNPDDQTYMPDTELLQEYVLNESGTLWKWRKQLENPIPLDFPWIFGQFDRDVLPAVMFLLDKTNVPYQHRGDVVKMVRYISAAINSDDDDGVLVGRWEEPYDDGILPTDWHGSVPILKKYAETKSPVRYGQCWVYAGLVNTVCRALGIPCRAVTGLDTAFDGDGSLTVDIYLSEKKEDLEKTWIFHVWNDVWMARPDLPLGYGGWQAIDATPQKKSSSKSQCGPAPLEAIKRGATGLSYDVDFMLATVDADVIFWQKDPNSTTGFNKTYVKTEKNYVGKYILTSKPVSFDPHLGRQRLEIITTQYKYHEGTEERLVYENSVRRLKKNSGNLREMETTPDDITFDMRSVDAVQIAQNFSVVVGIKNTSRQSRKIKLLVSATTVYYNGVKAGLVKEFLKEFQLKPEKDDNLELNISASDYLPKLVDHSFIKITALANVEETKQAWFGEDTFCFIKPKLDIKFPGEVVVGKPATVIFSFENPLEQTLTNCEVRVTSSGIQAMTLKFSGQDVAPRQTMHAQAEVIPKKPGNMKLVASFKSTELDGIQGSALVDVRAASTVLQ